MPTSQSTQLLDCLFFDTYDFTEKDRVVMQQLDAVHVPIVLPEVQQLDDLSYRPQDYLCD